MFNGRAAVLRQETRERLDMFGCGGSDECGSPWVVVFAAPSLSRCGGAFLPELRETHFVVHARGLPGTSLRESIAMGSTLTKRLMEGRAVAHVIAILRPGESAVPARRAVAPS